MKNALYDIEDERKIKTALLRFIIRVADGLDAKPEEAAILPAIVDITLRELRTDAIRSKT